MSSTTNPTTTSTPSGDNLNRPGSTWADKDGVYRRAVSSFRSSISTEPGSTHPPEAGRYHLYVCLGCPWAHRTLVVRALKGLEDLISISIVSPHMSEDRRWVFATQDDFPGATEDHIFGKKDLGEVYLAAEANYDGRYTVPVLFDKKLGKIVNNESAEIIRMLYHNFDALLPEGSAERELDLLPQDLEKEIDEMNAWVYDTLNNGVYKAGFATTQEAYESALHPVFASLDRLESLLSRPNAGGPYLFGPRLTEADVRLYTTLIRFDTAYYEAFKLNLKLIRHDYPALNRWMKNLYWNNGAFGGTTNFEHIKHMYHWSRMLNPNRIIPVGPEPPIEPL